ncbi:MFS transporter [Paenibacillus nasutitermitis]|uniref:Multi-drug efflux transporter n=1 Tax=Paenibacillus nasutitermitis TaxID=1652958 RepID=A0A917E2X8_9BACL|nr:MFS transporter [Paenibacillus nasutitermitis]GGD96284.1 putative multi-drug efflux transporter [Paenibacillus nasutitermitis]
MGAFVLSVTVHNRPGVLARISELFAIVDANIDRMSAGRTKNRAMSRLRIEAMLDDRLLPQLTGALQQLDDVLQIKTAQSRSGSFAYWTAAYGLFIAVMGLNLVTPLYALYKLQWGLTPGMLSLAFAAYAMAVIPSIIVFGQLSDRGGLRGMLVPGMLVALAGSLCLALAGGFPMLVVARVLQGLSVGIFNGVTVAALTKLHPAQDRRRAAMLGAIAVTAGNAIGPMLAGLLAQFAPMPTLLPYVVHMLLIVPGLIALLVVRADIPPVAGTNSRLHWPKLPQSIRKWFFVAALSSFISWGITSLFASIIPMYLEQWIGKTGFVLSGFIVAMVLTLSAISQLLSRKWPLRRMGIFGSLLIGSGLLSLLLTIHTGSILLLTAAILLVGFGYGPLYAGSLALVNEIAPDRSRGDVLSFFYGCTYFGVVCPALGLGIMTQLLGLSVAFNWFALILGGLLAVSLTGWIRMKGESRKE